MSDNHHSHSHHHHHGHHGDNENPMKSQDEFDKEETAKDWVTNPTVIFINEQLAKVFLERFQSQLDPQKTTLLDFGCGIGHLTKLVGPYVQSITGVDVSPAMIDMYQQQNYSNMKQAVCLNMTEFHPAHLNGDTFDFIVSFYVLHHVEHPEKMVQVLSSYLNPGGTLVFGEFVPLTKPSHFFNPGQLTGWLKDAGLENVSEDVALDLKVEDIPKPDKKPSPSDDDNKEEEEEEKKRDMHMANMTRIVLGQGTKKA
eukprot:scaffold1678_cov80-Cylindrotheca_fusiformis.AAC.2